MKVMSNFMTC